MLAVTFGSARWETKTRHWLRWSRADDSFHRYTPQDDGVPPSAPTAFADDGGRASVWIGSTTAASHAIATDTLFRSQKTKASLMVWFAVCTSITKEATVGGDILGRGGPS